VKGVVVMGVVGKEVVGGEVVGLVEVGVGVVGGEMGVVGGAVTGVVMTMKIFGVVEQVSGNMLQQMGV
jgi:hypothetical protein